MKLKTIAIAFEGTLAVATASTSALPRPVSIEGLP